MLLAHIQERIDNAPRYSAGISFSDRTIRYVEMEHEDGIMTLSAFGHVTIPFDVVKGGKVIDRVEFIESLKGLRRFLHQDTHLVIREQEAEKAEALSVVGFRNIFTKQGLDFFRNIFVPLGVDAKRLCVFANGDHSYFFHITGTETELVGDLTQKEFFSLYGKQQIRSWLKGVENKEIVCAGRYDDESFMAEFSAFDFDTRMSIIWQNLFDFARYVPEIPVEESYEYSVPVGLLAAGLFEDLKRAIAEGTTVNTPVPKRAPIVERKNTKRLDQISQQAEQSSLQDIFKDIKPMTKSKEDYG